jgi:hypothetical protein
MIPARRYYLNKVESGLVFNFFAHEFPSSHCILIYLCAFLFPILFDPSFLSVTNHM